AEGGVPAVSISLPDTRPPVAGIAGACSRAHAGTDRRNGGQRRRLALRTGLLFGLAILAPLVALAGSPREQLRLDEGWRFHRGDPAGVDGRLDYDVRPEVAQSADGKVADARPDAAERIEADRPVLKPWILPTANAFIADPARRHVPPAGTPPGSDVAFLQPDFDDSGWERVSLPHDW